MELIDSLKALSAKIAKQKDMISTEEATKNAFIMPFISAMGYDIFDPFEVIPEYTADIGTKKGEKVDYAIMKDETPIMFFECKRCGAELHSGNESQLYRYFATNSKTRVAILTNGILYQFYSDIDELNMLDSKPFLELNMLDIQEPVVNELKKMTKAFFNVDEIVNAASELKYMKATKKLLAEQLLNPDEEFVKFFASHIYLEGKAQRITQKIMVMFTDIVKRGFNQFVNEKINERLKSAMAGEVSNETIGTIQVEGNSTQDVPIDSKTMGIETTQDEIESFYIIKSITHGIVDSNRLFLRDFKGFCNIILDDSNLKPIIKLYYNGQKKQIGILDDTKKETKYQIESIEDIYIYSEAIKATVHFYLSPKSTQDSEISI